MNKSSSLKTIIVAGASLIVVLGIAGILLPDHRLLASSFVVDSNGLGADVNIGDGLCEDSMGNCTLNAAVEEANSNPGIDTITFNGPMTINFPPGGGGGDFSISDPVIIDASTVGTCPSGQGVVIDVNGGNRAFYLGAGSQGSTIKGFIVKDYADAAIFFEGVSGATTTVSCNVLGLDGTTPAGAGQGIYLGGGSSDIVIGGDNAEDRNTISGNQETDYSEGIGFNNTGSFTSSNIVIKNNYFGVDTSGTIAVPNGTGQGQGVDLYLGSYSDIVISSNLFAGGGIVVDSTADGDGLIIQSNTFDLQPDGETPINAVSGDEKQIDIYNFQNVLVGGITPDLGNISAGTGIASAVRFETVDGLEMYNNRFGVMADHTTPLLVNGGYQNIVLTFREVSNATIGGSPSLANYFVGGSRGTVLFNNTSGPSSNIVFASNYINMTIDETRVSEAGPVGLVMIGPSSNVVIGGTTEDERNRIHGTESAVSAVIATGGYLVEGNDLVGGNNSALIYNTSLAPFDTYVPFVRNNFLGSSGLALDISNDMDGDTVPEVGLGTDINDVRDTDEGANDMLNHPVLMSAVQTGGDVTVRYTLDVPSSSNPYRVEFFANPGSSSSFGPGEEYLDYENVTVSGSGVQFFSKTLSSVDASDGISATVTSCSDSGCTAYVATSEFSNTITGTTGGIDRGTASGSQTDLEDDGAYHIITDSYLGSCVNSDTDSISDLDSAVYTGVGPCADDRDGVVFGAASYGTDDTVTVTVTATDAGFLSVWADLNQDGDFSDVDEWFFVNEPVSSGTNNLVIPQTPSTPGTYDIRFRYTTYEPDTLLPTGEAIDGEVEDYQLVIEEEEELTAPSGPSGGGVSGGGGTGMAYACRDPKASNYRETGISDSSLCVYEPYRYDVDVKTPSPAGSGDPNMTRGSEEYYVNLFSNIVCPAFMQYARQGDKGEHVKFIQVFLNTFTGAKLPITGYFGAQTTTAVKAFQNLFAKDILSPWYPPDGLPATGYWYKTTRMKANQLLGCPEAPVILEDSGKVWDLQTIGN